MLLRIAITLHQKVVYFVLTQQAGDQFTLSLGEPIPRTVHYAWGETDADINAEVGHEMVTKYRNHLSGFLPEDAGNDGKEFAKVYWNKHTREMRASSNDFTHCRRMVRGDVGALSASEILRALATASMEVKGRKFYRETRCLPLGKEVFREHSAPLSFLGSFNEMVECVDNAACYATLALMQYLTWQHKRRFKVGLDTTFNCQRFVRAYL